MINEYVAKTFAGLEGVLEEELLQLEAPLSPEDRGSKNLMKLMLEDEFLSVYGSTFSQYVEPFYTVIMNEKRLLTEYYKKSKNRL